MKLNLLSAFSLLLFFLLMISSIDLVSQSYDETFEAEYQKRIRKTRIADVYIPKDLDDAFIELKRLSHPDDIRKFAAAEEQEVCRKLHFGLGKWMMSNWQFYNGSRFSHYIKGLGVTFPDDMAQFVLRSFHRHLNEVDLNSETLAAEYAEKRIEEHQRKLEGAETIGRRKRVDKKE